jgi:hypothetical protein
MISAQELLITTGQPLGGIYSIVTVRNVNHLKIEILATVLC